MTCTKEEIETALTWHRRTNENYVKGRDILFNAGNRVEFYGDYDHICEHILRVTLEEIKFTVNN